MRRAGLQKVRLKERRDIGAAVTIAQRPTFGQKRRFDHASAASVLAQQPDILSVPRHVSKVPTTEVKCTHVGAIDPLARSTAPITNFGLQTLFRDAVLPLVPIGDDILDERRGRRP